MTTELAIEEGLIVENNILKIVNSGVVWAVLDYLKLDEILIT